MKLVSIIIPYYKKRNYIHRAIKSILKQSYKKFEIIIVYNDPDKNDLPYIKKIKKIDKRIHLIINTSEVGAGHSRNIGIKKCKGDFIAFLDSDDEWKKNKIKIQLNFMKKKSISISHTSYEVINSKNKIIGYRKANNLLSYKDLLKSCDIGLSTVMVDKKILINEKFPNIKTKEDYVLWLNVLKKTPYIRGINKNLTNYRKRKNSLSSNFFVSIVNGYKVYKNYMKMGHIESLYRLLILSINYLKKTYIIKNFN